LYISGQIPLNPETGKLVEGGIQEQTIQVFKNIQAILQAAGYSFDDVIKSTVLLANMDDFAAMNAIYASIYTQDMPARAAYQVAKLPLGALVEIETIAVKGV
jgi:2-iminobutanoate/2-iminopropanoate deaminase